MKSSPVSVVNNILNNRAGRWLAMSLAVLVWFYSVMVGLGNGAVGASMLAMPLAVYILYTAGIAYGAMLYYQRSHLHIWIKLGAFLLLTGCWLIMMPWFGLFGVTILTIILWANFFAPNTNKVAEEGIYIQQGSRQVAKKLEKQRTAHAGGLVSGINVESLSIPGVPFGGAIISWLNATKNFLVAGTVGSGKSVSIDLILGAVFQLMHQVAGIRVLIYDAAGDTPGKLITAGIDPIIANPLDRRVRPWWMSLDIKTSTQAMAMAKLLAPDPEGSTDPYWTKCTQIFLTAVIRYLNTVAPEVWTFRDLLLSARDMTIITKMMEDEPKLNHYIQVKGSEKTAANIMSTVINIVAEFEVIAALWHKAESVYGNNPFSLTGWVKGEIEPVLVLGRSETAQSALDAVNRLLLTRAIQLLMEGPQTKFPMTWCFLDELGSLGGFKKLITAVPELRKRGVAIVAGFQSLSQLIDNFNENQANTIVANFGHVAALRLSDPKTEEFFCKTSGKVRYARQTVSETHSHKQGKSYTVNQTHGEEDVLRPGELNEIPIFDPALGVGLKGFYRSGHEKWWETYPPAIVNYLPSQGDPNDNFIPMPEEHQELEPWKYADLQRLNITHVFEELRHDIDTALDIESLPVVHDSPALKPAYRPAADNWQPLGNRVAELGDLSATDYLEQQFARFEEEYGISLTDDENNVDEDV